MDAKFVEVDVPAPEAGQLLRSHRTIRAEVDHEPPPHAYRFSEGIHLGDGRDTPLLSDTIG
ncbi:hypothetical protein GCM10018771_13510 [Streptomyces cellulosae]|nr:hypothetical protein GCM10018771_13510 [Streptomyces cellulosae]